MTETMDQRGVLPLSEASPLKLSVIIANYNYEEFVSIAIESALAVDWPDVEVIVVDDGSTDRSREVIEQFGTRIRAIFQPNATQRVARNRGYEHSSGDVIIHLDSDDVLMPSVMRDISPVFRAGVSKVQFQMQRINERGAPIGGAFPDFRRTPSAADIRKWSIATSSYPTPPGSGNAYTRWFLDQIFPLDDSCGPATDSACLAAAPVLGDVVTVAKPLAGYRIHGSNVSNMMASDTTFLRAVERARARQLYAIRIANGSDDIQEKALRRSRPLLQLRVVAARLTPDEQALPGDSRGRLIIDILRSPFATGPESIGRRVLVVAWSVAVLLATETQARHIVAMRYGRHR